jgi:hypothetical protein
MNNLFLLFKMFTIAVGIAVFNFGLIAIWIG